jgi:hypothetical protein
MTIFKSPLIDSVPSCRSRSERELHYLTLVTQHRRDHPHFALVVRSTVLVLISPPDRQRRIYPPPSAVDFALKLEETCVSPTTPSTLLSASVDSRSQAAPKWPNWPVVRDTLRSRK